MPSARSSTSSATVPLHTETPCWQPCASAKRRSNSRTISPLYTHQFPVSKSAWIACKIAALFGGHSVWDIGGRSFTAISCGSRFDPRASVSSWEEWERFLIVRSSLPGDLTVWSQLEGDDEGGFPHGQ